MKVFVFKPSNEPRGSFHIANLHELVEGFSFFVSNNPVKPYDYIECDGDTWTVVQGDKGLKLKEGRIKKPANAPLDLNNKIPMATTEQLGGWEITATIGIVFGESVVHSGVFNVGSEDRIREARREATQRLRQHALNVHADAVVGVTIDYEEIKQSALMICATGTAVNAHPIATDPSDA